MRKVQNDFQAFRQSKPKSNTRVFGLGFSFAKIQVLSAFFICSCAIVSIFAGFVWVCSYRFIRSICRRLYAAKGSWATERSVSGYLAKGKRKAPRGCRLAVYLPTDTLLRGSGQEHRGINRLRMYQLRITSLKSLSP